MGSSSRQAADGQDATFDGPGICLESEGTKLFEASPIETTKCDRIRVLLLSFTIGRVS